MEKRTRRILIGSAVAGATIVSTLAVAQEVDGVYVAPSPIGQILAKIAAVVTVGDSLRLKSSQINTKAALVQSRVEGIAARQPQIQTTCEPGANEMVRIDICPPFGECESLAYSCAPQRCIDGRCSAAPCGSQSGCASNAHCNTNFGLCVSGVVDRICLDEFNAKMGDGSEVPCSPYKCHGGECRSECITTTDCATGYQCRGQKCERIPNANP